MKVTIRRRVIEEVEVNFSFPIYRREYISEDEDVFWKFESHHKVTRIREKMSETTILTYNDKNADFIKDYMNEDMLFGAGNFSKIEEKAFDNCLQRLIDTIHRC